MENSWQQQHQLTTLQDNLTQAEINLSNKAHSRSTMHGRDQGAVFYSSPSTTSHKSGHPDLGSSFLALLSGPPSLLHYDIRELTDQSQLITSRQFPVDNGFHSAFGNGHKVPPVSVGLAPHSTSKPIPQNNVNISSGFSSKYVMSSINSSSALHGCDKMAQLNFQNSDIAPHIQLTAPYDGKSKNTATGCSKWKSSSDFSEKLHYTNMVSSRKLPLEVNSFGSTQSSVFMSGCPRVFCMGRSGDLLLSNTGLLGVVCSCHRLHMSIKKFCEHSGLHNIDPGDVVRVNSGETILQWRKLYFEKLGIRVPEDQSGWDWPDELSITCRSLKSSAPNPNMSDNSGTSHLFSWPRQPFDENIFLKRAHIGENLVSDALHKNQQRNVPVTGASLVKGFSGTLQGDLHDVVENQIRDSAETRPMPKYYDERSNIISQCFPGYRDPVTKSNTSSITLPALQNIRTPGRIFNASRYNDGDDGVIVEREAATSNIELRLGQPCQQRQNMGNPVSSLVGSERLGTLGHPFNLVSPEKMTQKTVISEKKLENMNYFHSDIGQSDSRTSKEHTQLNLGNNVFVNCNAAFTLDTNKFNMVKSSVIPVLPSFEMPIEKSVYINPVDNITNGKEHTMSHPLSADAQISSCSPVNLVSKFNPIDKGKWVEFFAGGSYISTDPTIRIYNQVESSRGFAEVDERACISDSAVHVKNIGTPQHSRSPLEASNNHKSLNSTVKISGLGNGFADLEFSSSQGIYAGLTSARSSSKAHAPPPLQKQDGVGVNPYFLDENLNMMASRQILELSKQQQNFSLLGINQDHSVVRPGMAGIQSNPLNITNKVDTYDGALKPFQFTYSSGSLDQSNILAPLTGKCADCSCLNNQSNESTFYPRSPLTCRRTESQLSNNLQCLHNSVRSHNNTQPSKHIWCNKLSTSANYQSNCPCSAQPICVGGNFKMEVMCSCGPHKEENWKVKDGASSLVVSEVIPAENTILSNQTETVKGQNPRDICHASQWKDVPRKIVGFDLTYKETSVHALDEGGNGERQLENRANKNCGGDSKCQETSNISSKCSAPAVTLNSAEVNNVNSSTAEVADSGHVDNSIVDEGSRIEKCSSPDEAFESEKSAEYPRSRMIDLENDGSSSSSGNLSSRSLLDELKLLDSMTWKRGRNQIHNGHGDNDDRNTKKRPITLNIGKTKRSIKFPEPYGNCSCQHRLKRRRSAFSSSEMFSRKVNQNVLYDDTDDRCGYQVQSLGHAGSDKPLDVFSGNEHQTDSTSAAFSKPGMYNTLVSREVPSCKHSGVVFKKARPVVCGKYGEISSSLDDCFPKPPKIVSLSLILKTPFKSTISQTCKPKVTKTKELIRMVDKGQGLSFEKDPKFKILVEVRSCDVSNLDALYNLYVKGTLLNNTARTTGNITSVEFNMQKKYNGSGCKELKAKYKEVRKRSLYELIMEGKNSGPETSSLKESLNDDKAVEVGREKSEGHLDGKIEAKLIRRIQGHECLPRSELEEFCSVCGGSNKDDINSLLECCQCFIRVHQACYGISRVPKGHWYCRPCQINAKDVACVLCGYGGGAMTRALKSSVTVKSLLNAWNIDVQKTDFQCNTDAQKSLGSISNFKVQNSITAGLVDNTVKQWIHMVCGLWTPGTRCPNVDTMSTFDVSGAVRPRANVVCALCRRPGGSCINCRVKDCSVQFHPWCAHQKGLLQSDAEGVDNENLGFYGRCILHSTKDAIGFENQSYPEIDGHGANEPTCARTEGYEGRKCDGFWHNRSGGSDGKGGCHVPQEQQNAWVHINRLKYLKKIPSHLLKVEVELGCRNLQKEYARYKQGKGWKHLVVYKSGIHALGLYTSQFISRGKMVVEYVGEIVGPRVADKREIEYQSGRRLHYKSACYFFRIDKEHIIDATRKGGIARFVNHSCQPNCVAKVISVKNSKKVVFLAERDIFPGEEITYDYHFNHEDEGKKIPCFCNSKNCRRYLN